MLKLDYEKAFDKVNLDFLEDLLKFRGFGGDGFNGLSKLPMGGPLESR